MARRDTSSSGSSRPRSSGAQGKPNILVIFGDDTGITNPSCYSDGRADVTSKTCWDW